MSILVPYEQFGSNVLGEGGSEGSFLPRAKALGLNVGLPCQRYWCDQGFIIIFIMQRDKMDPSGISILFRRSAELSGVGPINQGLSW